MESDAVKIGASDNAATMVRQPDRICPRCGAEILSSSPDEPCPACLLETGLDSNFDLVSRPVLRDFGDYEFIEEIGRGGQGVVYRVRQKGLNRVVALKVIALGPWATEPHLKKFRREAEMAASLDHAGIVPIYEFGERDGCCYFSMKFVDGDKLDQLVTNESMSPRRAAEVVAKLARAVAHAHERKVLHRDIKPGNVLIDGNGEPHLTDFGLARLTDPDSESLRTAEISGTPSYMAPEQVESKPLTPGTDVYGLGGVLYHLLTGRPPFLGKTKYETTCAVLESEPRRPRSVNPEVDLDLETICLKCLEKDSSRRYQSAAALADDLERWLRHEPIRARRSGMLLRSTKFARRNPVVAVLVTLLIALAAALAVTLWKPGTARVPTGIAVLPFQNLSPDNTDSLFADGIQDDILTRLAKIAGLKVISRTSVMSYRGDRDTRKIGQALGVSHVLEGSVQKSGNRIHLNAQLIDAQTDSHIWAEQYDGDMADIFGIQSDIASKIASQLKAKVTVAEKNAMGGKPTRDLEAYNLYVQAKALNSVGPSADNPINFENIGRAAELLEKAVARDPNFAAAYWLLAESNLSRYWVAGRVDSAYRKRAEAALREAERLAPDAGETHLVRALFFYYGNHEYDAALAELDSAARLLPNDANVFRISAQIERRLGRWSESLRHFMKASELDPRQPTHLVILALTYQLLRHYDQVDKIADRAIAEFPEAADEFWHLKGESGLARGDIKAARKAVEHLAGTDSFPFFRFQVLFRERNFAEAERFSVRQWQGKDPALARWLAVWSAVAARLRGDLAASRDFFLTARQAYEPVLRGEDIEPGVLAYVGVIDVGLGRKEEGLQEVQKAIEVRPISRDALEGVENSTFLALAYIWAGERDRAIEQLASVVNLPNGPTLGALKWDPLWDELRDHPQFARLLAEAAKPIPVQIVK